MRTGAVLAHGARALRLAAGQLDGGPADPAGPAWASVGLVTALQAGCVVALSGYETADPGDILGPNLVSAPARRAAETDNPGRVTRREPELAPVTLLLRRASSPRYLNPPEQLSLSRKAWRELERLVATRNGVLHPGLADPFSTPNDLAGPIRQACTVIGHVTLHHPAFDPAPHKDMIREIGDLLERISS